MNKIKHAIENSYLMNRMAASFEMKKFHQSLFFRIINGIFGLAFQIPELLGQTLKKHLSESVLLGILTKLSNRFEYFFALMYFAIMCIPDSRWKNKYFSLFLILLMLLFLPKIAREKKELRKLEDMDPYFLFFQLFFLTATITSVLPGTSMKYLLAAVLLFLLSVTLLNSMDRVSQLEVLTAGIALSAFVIALYSLYKLRSAGIAIDPAHTDVSISQGLGVRSSGTFGNPNIFGEFLVLSIPFLLAMILNQKGYRRLFWSLVLLPTLFILVKTGSRSAWLAFALLFTAFALMWRLKSIFLLLAGGLVAFYLMPDSIYVRILSIFNRQDTSMNYRKKIYDSTMLMIRNHPFGIGLGSSVYETMLHDYKVEDLTKAAHSHNLFLQIWAEQGIFALLIYIIFLIRIGIQTFWFNLRAKDEKLNNIMLAAFTSIFGLMIMGLAEHIWFYFRIQFALWVNISILFICFRLKKAERADTH